MTIPEIKKALKASRRFRVGNINNPDKVNWIYRGMFYRTGDKAPITMGRAKYNKDCIDLHCMQFGIVTGDVVPIPYSDIQFI